jgi:hypothetical protein
MMTPRGTGATSAPRQIELESATIRRRDDGVVDLILAEQVEVTVERAQAMNAAIREVCDGPSPIFADVRGMRSSGILTMRYTAGPEAAAVTSKLAMLVGSPVSRMLVNVLIGLWKPPYPTRLFTDEDEARAWLLEDHGRT